MDDPRRLVPRTDTVLADPRLVSAAGTLGREVVRTAVRAAQDAARSGVVAPEAVADLAASSLPATASTLRPVLNATGVVVHTNLGRAPLSQAALDAVGAAAGYVDVEYDIATGSRARRGRGLLAALRDSVPDAGDVLVVNNGAAALLLAVTALGGELLISRGEMVEIGDGFRLPDLMTTLGARLREVGTTNRVTPADYRDAVGPDTRGIVKIHPSNFRVEGFTSSVPVAELAALGLPVVVDIGSDLLASEPLLPDEPDAASALRAGAAVVTCSGDKLLGGPQAGLLLGDAALIERLRRHPLARALRVDKLTIAALEATLRGPEPPVRRYLRADTDSRTQALAARLGLDVVEVEGAVGGGGAPGVPLPGPALALPPDAAVALRAGHPPVVARVEHGRCLVDLRCIEPDDDDALAAALTAVLP